MQLREQHNGRAIPCPSGVEPGRVRDTAHLATGLLAASDEAIDHALEAVDSKDYLSAVPQESGE